MAKRIIKLLEKYREQFHSVDFNAILQDMNFPTNYQELL